jgi:alcohol dehydrogenase
MMRQLTFVEKGCVEWREVSEQQILSGIEALVRPMVLGRRDLDVAYVQGLVPLAAAEAIGHEMIGTVIDVGDCVTRIRPGQRVIVPAQISCGTCRNCRRGFTGRCQSVAFSASYGIGRPGNYGCAAADLVRVPLADAMLVPLPDGADALEFIGPADMAIDSWRAVGPHLAKRPGATVLVMGGGLAAVIGIYAAGLAAALGAGRVDYADDDDFRLVQAALYGANPVKLPAELPIRYEIVVEAGGSEAALVQAIRTTGRNNSLALSNGYPSHGHVPGRHHLPRWSPQFAKQLRTGARLRCT